MIWTSGFLGLKSCHRYSGDSTLLGLLIHIYLSKEAGSRIIKRSQQGPAHPATFPTCSGDSPPAKLPRCPSWRRPQSSCGRFWRAGELLAPTPRTPLRSSRSPPPREPRRRWTQDSARRGTCCGRLCSNLQTHDVTKSSGQNKAAEAEHFEMYSEEIELLF